MIIHDQKKAMQTIMTRRQGLDGDVASAPLKQEVVTSADGELDGRHSAASDILAAIHEKSPAKLMDGLANFHDLHVLREAQSKSESSKMPRED